MSVLCDGTPTPLPPNDRYMWRAAAVTSIGPDRFMRSNKTIATDQDPCQWMKLSFPVKRKFKLPMVWQVLTSKLEITFLSHKEKGPVFQKGLLQKLNLQSFVSFHCDRTFVTILVDCFENISGGFLIYCVFRFCSIIETEKFYNYVNCTIYI